MDYGTIFFTLGVVGISMILLLVLFVDILKVGQKKQIDEDGVEIHD